MAFDPSRFGFTEYKSRTRGGQRVHGCYLRLTKASGDSKQLELVTDRDATEILFSMFGDRVGVALDDKGRILVWKDNLGRKLSRNKKSTSEKGSINLASMTNEYISKMGNFVHLYVDYDSYAGGEAIVFTPTGERDMR